MTLSLLGAGPGARVAGGGGGNFVLLASANGGQIESGSDVSYALAVAGAGSSFVAAVNPATTTIGQYLFSDEGSFWDCFISYLEFDVSSISGTVSTVTLALYISSDNSDTDFTLEARTCDYGATLTLGDWINSGAGLGALTLLASKTSLSLGAGYNNFTESGSALRDAVTTAKAGSGLLRMIVCSSRQRGLNEPADNEFAVFQGSNNTNKPRLTVVTT